MTSTTQYRDVSADQYPDDTHDDGDYPTNGSLIESPLAALKRAVDTKIVQPTLLRHPLIEDYAMEFRREIDARDIQKWHDIAGRGRGKGNTDRRLEFALIMANTNTRILRAGEVVVNGAGQPVSFRDKELMDTLEVGSAAACVIAFIDSDGHLGGLANAILAAAGYGEDVEQVDPTELGR